jgi:hypothetical protein
LGIPSTSGQHADGHWIEFIDPDGIALRVIHSAAGPRTFLGVRSVGTDGWEMYETPRLTRPPVIRPGDR